MRRLLVGLIVGVVGALALGVAPTMANTFYCRDNTGCTGTGSCQGDYVVRTACRVDCYNTVGEQGELEWVGDGGCHTIIQ